MSMNPKQIQIEPEYLEQIKSVLAYPIDEQMFEVFTDTYIREYALYPAMVEYFKKFPIAEQFQTITYLNAEYPFPDTFTFGCLDARHVNKDGLISTNNGFGFLNLVYYNNLIGNNNLSTVNRWGSRYNFNGAYQAGVSMEQLRRTQIEDMNTFNIQIDMPNRKVLSYTTFQCEIYIKWAKNSNLFSDVQWNFKDDVIKLAQSNFLSKFATMAAATSNREEMIGIDAGSIKELAQSLKDEVKDKWNDIPDILSMNFS